MTIWPADSVQGVDSWYIEMSVCKDGLVVEAGENDLGPRINPSLYLPHFEIRENLFRRTAYYYTALTALIAVVGGLKEFEGGEDRYRRVGWEVTETQL